MDAGIAKLMRCAIYTRKSGDAGLEQEVNSLDAQREVCSAYIKCNAHRGWVEVSKHYDDGGYSGGSLDRPALSRLLADAHSGKVDVIVFYKIDRLTRSLSDFVRVMEDAPVSFVSVTQAFDTSDTMGRLILNILLTFAQFEREMLTDRIRDKLRTMRQRGLFVNWMPPLGYDKVDGRLVVNPDEAEVVRGIFRRFETASNAHQLLLELRSEGVRTKRVLKRDGAVRGGVLVNRGSFYKMLKNPLYAGLVAEDGGLVDGGHEAILDRATWDRAQERHAALTRHREKGDPTRYLLRGLLRDENGRHLVSDTSKDDRYRKRYYQTEAREIRRGKLLNKVRVPAPQLETLVQASITSLLGDAVRVREALSQARGTDDEDHSLSHRCTAAAACVRTLSRAQWRLLLENIVVEAVVSPTGLCLRLSIATMARVISAGGDVSKFTSPMRESTNNAIYLVRVSASLMSPQRDFSLPLQSRDHRLKPDRKLVNLLKRAFEARESVMNNRETPLAMLAREMKMTSSRFARLLRLTYLAPDIQAAIMDGRQPPDLSARKLTYAPLPLDWAEQREFFGFATA